MSKNIRQEYLFKIEKNTTIHDNIKNCNLYIKINKDYEKLV